MADFSDYEGDDDIVKHYENQGSDEERDGVDEAEEANDDNKNEGRRIDPPTSRTHIVRNPAPKLNTERLKGPMGIQMIEKYFEGFKFHGKEHEKTDLDRIMKRLEHWSHRLFPKYHFDDFLARVEQLGTKKDLQVYIKKYRLDMITQDDDLIVHDNIDDEEENQQESAPVDDFDLLISEQIQKQKQAEAVTPVLPAVPSTSSEDAFNELLMQSNNIPNSQVQNIASNALSNDIKEKIEKNKQLAIQRRLQRQKERDDETKRQRLVQSTNTETLSENNNSTIDDNTNISQIDNIQAQINEDMNKAIRADRSEEALLNETSVTDYI